MHGHLVVAALVDRKAVSLATPITSDCDLRALTTVHWEGQRIHRQSVGLLALEAAHRLAVPVTLSMGSSIGFAQRIAVSDATSRGLDVLARELEAAMHELAAEHATLREEWWTVEAARAYFERQGSPAAALLETWRELAVPLVTYGKVYALGMGPLLPDAATLTGFHVTAGDDVLLLAYGPEAAAVPLASTSFSALLAPEPSSFVERQARRTSAHVAGVIRDEERWLGALGITSVGALNHACVTGDVSEVTRVSEGFHEKRIGAIADEIRERRKDVRVVCIAGPSSSGKTTFIRRLKVQLQVNGIRPVGVSLDDYYVDRERTPLDESGEYDYEALEAIDLLRLGDHLARLLAGERVTTSRYDFHTGKAHPEGGAECRLEDDQVLLLEGIHGLNPGLLGTVPAEHVFRVFCCPLSTPAFDRLTRLHASDVRLLRRIVRDRLERGTTAADNIQRWPSVRAGERRHIFPFQHHADAVFDSTLVYEPNVLRVYAERYLLEVPQAHPSYTTAFRLIRLLDRFVAVYPDHVPPTSILREFIGGSGFRY
jgi:uridine kinase